MIVDEWELRKIDGLSIINPWDLIHAKCNRDPRVIAPWYRHGKCMNCGQKPPDALHMIYKLLRSNI